VRFEHHDKWMARFLHKGDNVSFLVPTSGYAAESRTHLGRQLSTYYKKDSTNDAASTIAESSDEDDGKHDDDMDDDDMDDDDEDIGHKLDFFKTINGPIYKFLRFEDVHSELVAIFLQKKNREEFPVHTYGAVANSKKKLLSQLGVIYKRWKKMRELDEDDDDGDDDKEDDAIELSDDPAENNGAIGLLSLSGSPVNTFSSVSPSLLSSQSLSIVAPLMNSTIATIVPPLVVPPPSFMTSIVPSVTSSAVSIDDIVVGLDPVLKAGILDWLKDNDIADINLLMEIGQTGIDDLMGKLPFKNPNGHAAQLIRKRITAMCK
jgi:hypothetical protein